jgi:hypothetical protein
MTLRIAAVLAVTGLSQSAIAQCPPSEPQNVRATKATWCGSIVVTWNEVSGANNYSIYRGTTPIWGNSSLVGVSLFGDPQFTDVTAAVGQTYYYWVTAKRNLCLPGSGTSEPGGPDTGWRDQDPLAPTDVLATDGTVCGGVLVTWNQPVPTHGGLSTTHTIYRNTINLYLTSSAVGTTGPGAGYFLDESAEVGETYYYWVRAENQCGTAASSGDSGFVTALPAPTNDACTGAPSIGPGTYVGSTACATNDGSATCDVATHNPRDVWYAFNAPAPGTLHVDTCGATGSFNTVLSIRAACQGTELACNDNACGQQSSINLQVQAGSTYYIRVSGRGNLDIGVYQLNVGFTPQPGFCYANCDASTGNPKLTANDFQCFLNRYAAGESYANCDGTGGLTANDFACFLNQYAGGCS